MTSPSKLRGVKVVPSLHEPERLPRLELGEMKEQKDLWKWFQGRQSTYCSSFFLSLRPTVMTTAAMMPITGISSVGNSPITVKVVVLMMSRLLFQSVEVIVFEPAVVTVIEVVALPPPAALNFTNTHDFPPKLIPADAVVRFTVPFQFVTIQPVLL